MKPVGNALSFDDILLVPQGGTASRSDVDLSMRVGDFTMRLPVFSSPMATITEYEMAAAIGRMGGMGIIHRYLDVFTQVSVARHMTTAFGAAIGLNDYDRYEALSPYVDLICVDIANGHDPRLPAYIRELKRLYSGLHIMAGNVSTYEGYTRLADAGADSVRVGIGGGSVCSTRIVSGHGVPTLESLLDIYNNGTHVGCSVIADGGMRTPGDIVKAFAAGADAVMLGGMLAGTDEAPGEVIDNHKLYAGMASNAYTNKVEGVAVMVPTRGPVGTIIENIKLGLGSGCSYSGVTNLSELAGKAKYVTVSHAGVRESQPHAISTT